MSKIDLVFRMLVVMTIVFIVGKTMAPAIFTLFSQLLTGKKKKKNVELDTLIEAKKQMLRQGAAEKKAEGNKPIKAESKNSTIKEFDSYFKKVSKAETPDTEKIEDVKKIMVLFDSLQWGSGDGFNSILKKVKSKTNATIPQTLATKSLNKLISRDILLGRKTNNLPQYNEVLSVIETKIYLEALTDEARKKTGPIFQYLSKLHRVNINDTINGFLSLILKKENKKPNEIFDLLLKNKFNISTIDPEKLDIIHHLMLLDEKKQFFVKSTELIKSIAEESEFFSSLSPLPSPKNKNDIETCYEIFQIDKNTTKDEIKKIYKKLASLKHPDKLSGRGIPKEFESIATENFANIQMAYDILSKHND